MADLEPSDFYRVDSEASAALKGAVSDAMQRIENAILPYKRRIAGIYTSRDPGGREAVPFEGQVPHADRSGLIGQTPETAVNLFLSRLQQITEASTPGRPTFTVTPRAAGALGLVEEQQDLLDVLLPHSNIEEEMERAAFLLPTENYIGFKVVVDPDAPTPLDAFKFKVIESSMCGYEPFLRRFQWHTYQVQWANVTPEMEVLSRSPEDPPLKPWDIVTITEVYHPGMPLSGEHPEEPLVPVSVFMDKEGRLPERTRDEQNRPQPGRYVGSRNVLPTLSIEAGLDAAPNEDVAPAEAAAWVPLMDNIVQVVTQIVREIENTNNDILYNTEAIKDHQIAKLISSRAGTTRYIGVQADNSERGVNATMRPVERNSPIGDYIGALNTLLALFDDITGVGPLDRGTAVNPEKSATEAASLVQNSNRRTTGRLRVLARLWRSAAEMLHLWQRTILGKTVEVPLRNAKHTIEVPNPATARFAFQLDVDTLESMSRARQLDTAMTAHTILTNHVAAIQSPTATRMLNESLRRLLKQLGWRDVDRYVDLAPSERSALERYIRAVHTGKPVVVLPGDDHESFIAEYESLAAASRGQPDFRMDLVQDALASHQAQFQRQRAAARRGSSPQAPVPGVSADGAVDNQARAAAVAGLLPAVTKQTLGRPSSR